MAMMCFFDFTGLGSGDFERVIIENIMARAHFVLLLTPSALDRCGDPQDWLRREIATAMKSQRNIVPLMIGGFNFESPAVEKHLEGEVAKLSAYTALRIPVDYFGEAMVRLREKYLDVPLDAVLHPTSSTTQKIAKSQQIAANSAPRAKLELEQAHQDVNRPEPSGYELVLIKGGTFMMGSDESDHEKPVHKVAVPDFYMGRYPVTNEEYSRFIKATGYQEPRYWGDRNFNQPRQPVVKVSWHDTKAFAKWAGLRLPSEAQWEYACRAGTTTRYYTGDSEDDLNRAGWYYENSGDKLHPIGEKEPNAFGLYDMHGNVYEWCEEHWHDNYKGAPVDGSARVDRDEGSVRVVRGGSWSRGAVSCRAANRYRYAPGYRSYSSGFRLVRLPGQPGEPGQSGTEHPGLRFSTIVGLYSTP